ncbi:hypothetical protein B4N89_43110 [Embleya scabrispora]|uniref:Uncharacterized protein n=1 Tax=Embleya scabrispora TaxID=159449 RepID=A0A1T3NKY2_9ACTN|nr:hypothetical protein [Embleya scabrispora]OPC77315.1 hypothetical protein B4N89_43110 [Embleya scabrispora]
MATTSTRPSRGALLVAGLAAALLSAAAPAMASGTAAYCGGGMGPTADIAVRSAIEDAQDSARTDGRHSCEPADAPQVFEVFDDPYRGHVFYASVTLNCG